MFYLKKTAVAVLAFGSSAVFAGTMGPVCTPGSVTVPCEQTAWGFGAQALYLQPSLSNLGYVRDTISDGIDRYHRHNYNWGWGFEVEGSYHFSTGNDLNLNWYHWNHSSNGVTPVQGINQDLPLPAGSTIVTKVQPKWDAVNLEFGQHVDLGEFDKVRFHGGVAYARIANNGSEIRPLIRTIKETITANVAYNGFGPRVGADLFYTWNNGFNIYAKAASAIFVGTGSFNATVTLTPGGATLMSAGSSTEMVPELEGKLGASYTYAMAQGDLSLDAGWMWINYFNAINFGLSGSEVISSDFALQGPFIGLKWVGNIA